ncbi:major facilitator superfamily transporter [Pseudomassariella vexata]|uniref:Major facilitator superfamily transporter n=1 Tax=Pseudomassariella vexata TaxID=1141098 RepID=A0A1Y2EDE8_9PEZI|nr:major facilitator superfamily transporter [Pseudomassariella vexata]ORY69603.1 major facilitator superfamily transporter [Pseudomassariella vexata]
MDTEIPREIKMSPHSASNEEKSDGPEEVVVQTPRRQIRGFAWFLVIGSIFSSMFIYALDNTITADLVPAIAIDFGSVSLLPWLSVGFQVGAYVALLPVGKLYAKFNAKWVYIINVVFFLAASALCGAAPNMTAMIIGRVFLGVSGSAIYCGILYLITVLCEERERGLYVSLAGLVWGVGTVLGPVVGGAFEKVSWRWAFYINIIIGIVFLPVCLFLLPPFDPLPLALWKKRAEKFDFLGTILFVAFSICLVMAINFGGVLYPWRSGSIIALFVVGGLLFIVFVVQQRYSWLTTRSERLYPAQILRIREADLLALSAICSNTAIFVPIFYIPVYFQFTRNDSAIEAAVRLLPLIVVVSVALVAQGYFMVRLGYYWPWYTVGAALGLVGNVLLYLGDFDTSEGYIYGAEVLVGLGLGIFNQAGYTAIYKAVPSSEAGNALPFMMVAQYSGVTMGLSVAGAVFINDAMNGLRSILPTFPDTELTALISGTSNSAINAVPEELRGAVITAIVESLRKVFIPAFFGSAVCLVISGFLSKKRAFGGKEAAPVVAG